MPAARRSIARRRPARRRPTGPPSPTTCGLAGPPGRPPATRSTATCSTRGSTASTRPGSPTSKRARRGDLPGVRPQVRDPVRRPLRRAQLRRLVVGTGGLIIDVENLKDACRSPGTTANVGAGTRLIDFYNGLAAKGRAVPGGSCPTVGIAGLTLGGGVGVTGPGLRADLRQALDSLHIVTANGAALTASADSSTRTCSGPAGRRRRELRHRHLRSRSAPCPPRAGALLPVLALVAGGQGDRRLAVLGPATRPTRCGRTCTWRRRPAARTPTIQVGGCYLGSVTGAHNLIEQLYAKVGSPPPSSGYFLNQYSFLNAMLFEAGCAHGLPPATCPGTRAGGTLTRQPQFAKSDLLLQAAVATRGSAPCCRRQQPAVGARRRGRRRRSGLRRPGRRNQPGLASATAFVHRNALFGAQYTTDWNNGAAAAGINNQHAWLRSFWASMRPYANGQAYQNYIDPDLTNWSQAYYAPELPAAADGQDGPTTRPACSTSRRPSCPPRRP